MRVRSVFGLVALAIALYVGYSEVKLQTDLRVGDCRARKLGGEESAYDARVRKVLPDIINAVRNLTAMRATRKLNDDPNADGVTRRGQHPIAFGCLFDAAKIHFELSVANVVKSGHAFAVDVRFSKGGFESDGSPKVTAIALKIRGVVAQGGEGKRMQVNDINARVVADNVDTLDLIFLSSETLPMVATPEDLHVLTTGSVESKSPFAAFFKLHRVTLLARLMKLLIGGISTRNSLLLPHFAIHPSKVDNTAVRWRLYPCTDLPQPEKPADAANDFIAQLINSHLASHEGCMKLQWQKQLDPCTEDVENLVEPWNTAWETVATLKIPKGSKIENSERCENTSFNPFHGPESIRPLGWVAKVRGELYAAASSFRIEQNAKR